MKKVLFVTTISGFLPQFEMNDVEILQQSGYEVHYASNFLNPVYEMDEKALQKAGIKLHQIDIQKSPIRVRKNSKALRQLYTLMKEERIDVIHCHNPMGGVLGRLAAFFQKRRIFVVYTAHGFHFYKGAPVRNKILYFGAEYLLARCTDRLITINGEDFERAKHFPLRKGGRAEKIPGVGLKTERFRTGEDVRMQTRKELGIGEDMFYILSVGELNANKNHKVIIRALANIGDKRICYGICGRGPLKEELLKTARKFKVENQVKLWGFRNDIPKMLSAADCFVFPSKREGLGMAALEAMAAGLPVIASDCRGTREYMRDGRNGIVCREGTADAYAQAILKLKNNEDMRKSMSEQGTEIAKQFDLSETDRIMRKLYAEIPE